MTHYRPIRHALLAITDPSLRRQCREALERSGCATIEEVESGAAAVTQARLNRPEIILLSPQLNDVSALEAMKWLRANREMASTPILVLGSASEAMSARPFVSVVPRPVTPAKLRAALDDLLAPEARLKRAAP